GTVTSKLWITTETQRHREKPHQNDYPKRLFSVSLCLCGDFRNALLTEFHEVRDAVQDHPKRQHCKRKQNENEIGRLLECELKRVEVALLDRVDLIKSRR